MAVDVLGMGLYLKPWLVQSSLIVDFILIMFGVARLQSPFNAVISQYDQSTNGGRTVHKMAMDVPGCQHP